MRSRHIQQFDQALLADLQQQAEDSPRRRAHFTLHASHEDSVQRMLVVMQPESYIRPHWHSQAEKWELITLLSGSLVYLVFDESGKVLQRSLLTPTGPVFGIEVPAGNWHSLVALEPGTSFLEVKQGPYLPLNEEDFANWSPPPASSEVVSFLEWMASARQGERYSG